jgi:hypothetical protein
LKVRFRHFLMTNLKVRESQKIYIGKKVGPCLQNFPTEDTLLNERLIINYELITVFKLVSSILLGLWGQGGRVEVWAFKSLSRLNFVGWSMKWKFSNIRICSNGYNRNGPRSHLDPWLFWSPRNLVPEKLVPKKFGPQECWSLHENAI